MKKKPELVPKVKPFHAYRYTPHKDVPDIYVEFLCIRYKNGDVDSNGNYLAMILYDHAKSSPEDEEWNYGDIKTLDWHVELQEMKTLECDIQFAKLMAI
jgi:hypothetical protein